MMGFEVLALAYNVVKLLTLMKSLAYGSNDKIYPSRQVADVLKQLPTARQQESEVWWITMNGM